MPENVSRILGKYVKEIAIQGQEILGHVCQQEWHSLEIVSDVILRYRDLKTTQVYLGKISDSEAIRWKDIVHGK